MKNTFRSISFILVWLIIITLSILNQKNQAISSIDAIVNNNEKRILSQSDFISRFVDNNVSLANGGAYFLNRVNTVEDLEENSDLIATVIPISRVQYGDVIETKCEVVEVHQGLFTKRYLYVFELYTAAIYINPQTQSKTNTILNVNGIHEMQNTQEYIVFLRNIEGYKNSDRYNLTSSLFGYFRIDNVLNVLLLEDREAEHISDVFEIDDESSRTIDIITFEFTKETIHSLEYQVIDSLTNLELKKDQYSIEDYTSNYNALKDEKIRVFEASNYLDKYNELNKVVLNKYASIIVEGVNFCQQSIVF